MSMSPNQPSQPIRPDWARAYCAPPVIDWELAPPGISVTVPLGWPAAPGSKTRGTVLTLAADGTLVTPEHLCPDMLRWSNIGPADGMRGRVVRGFFYVMRLWPPKGMR